MVATGRFCLSWPLSSRESEIANRQSCDLPTSAKKNEILYCGYRFDPETRLYHVRNRAYHPTLGRWLQRDPLEYVDGMNLYEYVGSRPTVVTDPTGEAVPILVGAAAAVVGKTALVLGTLWLSATITEEVMVHLKFDPHSPSESEKDALWWAWRLLHECRHTAWMAERIENDLFFGEVHAAGRNLVYPGVGAHAFTYSFWTRGCWDREIYVAENLLSQAAANDEARLRLAETLWHEYQHWDRDAPEQGETGAYWAGYDVMLRLFWCWCEGNTNTRASVSAQDLAFWARINATRAAMPEPAWVDRVMSHPTAYP